MECPKCRREIKGDMSPEDLVFCHYCGEKMTARQEEEFSFCPSCGQKLPLGAAFCPRCGKNMKVPEKPCDVQEAPKQSLMRSREEITELVNSEVDEPFAEPQPETVEAKLQPKLLREPLWSKIMALVEKLVGSLKDFISGQWRLRRLYRKWAKDGVFEKMFEILNVDADMQELSIDSTSVKVHQHAAGAKKGPKGQTQTKI